MLRHMIISHLHKFIFIKTKKTASTSIEVGLSGICGPRDAITPLMKPDEARRRKMGYRGMQNFKLGNGKQFHNHMGAAEVRSIVGDEIWSEYYTFCFERNPWDKTISEYFWKLDHFGRIPFDQYLCTDDFAALSENGGVDLYTADGEVIVDKVYAYEQLDEAYHSLAARFGLKKMPDLPRFKSTSRTDRRPYREFISKQQGQIIEQAFRREVALFGYVF